ncbi:MAG: chorismate synthase [Acidobacteriota bacterium]
MRALRFLTAGESHGPSLTVTLDGLPAGLEIDLESVNKVLRRRMGGYGRGPRMKIEADCVRVLAGIRHGRTLGSPVALSIENKDHIHWLDSMSAEPVASGVKKREVTRPRPGHADLAGALKYNTHDVRDILERASARETAARTAAGALAMQFLEQFSIWIVSHVIQVGGAAYPAGQEIGFVDISSLPEDSPLRVVDAELEKKMMRIIDHAASDHDTVGGAFEVVAAGVPPGLGSHRHWDTKLDGRLAGALMSIQAIKAVEIGMGVHGSASRGSEVHDEIYRAGRQKRFTRRTNRAGGIEGGITNGAEVRVRAYMKPLSTLRKPLGSVDVKIKQPFKAAVERSDVTAITAAGVVGEAMVALVLADAFLEKFGGDSLGETYRNFRGYQRQLQKY